MIMIFTLLILNGCKSSDDHAENYTNETVERIKPEGFADAFLNEDFEKIHNQMSKAFQGDFSLKQLQDLGEDFNKEVSDYALQSGLPYGDHTKQYVWVDDTGTKGMVVIFDDKEIIQGLQIMPLTTYPETDVVYTNTIFDFPFEEEWFVFWSGTNSLVNYHYEYKNQRYAYDFLIMKDGTTYEDDPTSNESYYAFGEAYLAPADGTIVQVENSVADNKPVGQMKRKL